MNSVPSTIHNKVVIVGRPNVGKSTLFNRLTKSRRAIVHDRPGVTRDRIIEEVRWNADGEPYDILLIDTGGLGHETFEEEIAHQVELAIQDAKAIIIVFDGREGPTHQDREVVQRIRKATKHVPMIGAVNKVDIETLSSLLPDFYSLGLEHLFPISAEHNRGIEDLKEATISLGEFTPAEGEAPEDDRHQMRKVAIVGRPNVGKSTLLNAILGEERVITSPVAGTTSDSVDVVAEIGGKKFLLIDTAGVRRRNKTEQGIEVLSVVQTKKALERADIALLILDGEVGTSDQDEKIAGLIEEAGCSVVIAMNKWDTQARNHDFTTSQAAERIRSQLRFLQYAPITFISGLKNQGLEDLPDLIDDILEQRKIWITTKELTEWVRVESEIHNPDNAKFYHCQQTGRNPPTFVCHVNDPKKIRFSLSRHIVNAMREKWGYMGTPVRLRFLEAEGKGGRRGR